MGYSIFRSDEREWSTPSAAETTVLIVGAPAVGGEADYLPDA